MSTNSPRHHIENDNEWSEWNRRSDGKDQIIGGDKSEKKEDKKDDDHFHVVYNNDEDRTLDYFRLQGEDRDNPSFDSKRGDVYPSDDDD